MTTLEITHSVTEPEIEALVSSMPDGAAAKIANHTINHYARLIKPLISYDAAALALCFVPAAGEDSGHTGAASDLYTYHHLRRDIFNETTAAGVKIAARYVLPSAHVTIARFVTQRGFLQDQTTIQRSTSAKELDRTRVREFVDYIEKINRELKLKYWPQDDGHIPLDGQWLIGHERGLELRKGRSWYGGGTRVLEGAANAGI